MSVDRGRGAATKLDRLAKNFSLDGLRLIAVANVIAGHLKFPGGGAEGVTVFFVISGYLITGLLLKEREKTGAIQVGAFYRRRLVRLGPALICATIAYLAYLAWASVPAREWWTGLVGTLTYTNDIILATGTGVQTHGSVFTWSWSLGVEEQFYLVWPLLILLLLRRRMGRTALAVTCIVIIIMAWLIRWSIANGSATMGRAYYSFDVHMDAIAWGALIAILASVHVFTKTQRTVAQLWLVVAAFGFPILRHIGHEEKLVAVLSTVVVLGLVAAPDGLIGRALGWSPLAYLGRLSYGLYLWNYVVVLAIEKHLNCPPRFSNAWTAFAVLVMIVISAMSYHLVESPIRRRWASPRPGAITVVAGN